MKSKKLRKLYLDFFKSKNHTIVDSSPMVVKNDPTLMFTNAGMNQFKDIFLDHMNAKYPRVANSQKCLRVSGKHNDLDEVGHDTYHHTMFEMLGSWSFGDYFKETAIDHAWDFLVNICKFEKDRLYVTVFEGDNSDKLTKDVDAYEFWKKYLPEERIIDGNKKDNFWEMGETGPCGPCSEIHFDNRDANERLLKDGKTLVNMDHPEVIEIWNLVFMQYNRSSDSRLNPLKHTHVDTGMGFERLAMIMQEKKSNYDTDIFQPIIQAISIKARLNYGDNEKQDIAMRVIADHLRAVVFSISDGQLPSNAKAGYVIRRILRRALRYAYTFLNLKESFIFELVPLLCTQMSEPYPELINQQEFIQKVVKEEEESFLRTLSDGLKRIEHITRESSDISGKQVFELYDTYGFPVDLTSLILNEKNLSFNILEFDVAMQEQKDRSKNASKIVKGDWIVLIENEATEFVGYDLLESEIKITRYREIQTEEGEQFQFVFNRSPFYPQGGGQVGDTGFIQNQYETIEINDTKKENNLVIHFSDKFPEDVSKSFISKVNVNNRKSSSRNHSATHLLQESLINILGNHISQKGSLVCPEYLRFDFTHFSKIDNSDLLKIEDDINMKILANIPLVEHNNLPISKAKESGAIMLFSEKYEDNVRMIQFDNSKELCGGTHVSATGEIGMFKILTEASVSSGIRRIEAITGSVALEYFNKKESLIKEITDIVKNKDILNSVKQLVVSKKQLENQVLEFKKVSSLNIKSDLLNSAEKINKIRFIGKLVDMDADDMKNISFSFKKEANLILILGSKTKLTKKAILSVLITDDLVSNGLSAVNIIKEISKEIKGGGGGQPFFATAGRSDVNGIQSAIDRAKDLIK